MGLTTATVLIAAATLLLAAVTVVTLMVTIRRDDRLRREDRERDDLLRSEQRARDDQLREEAADAAERRERIERRAREDYEARQVLVAVDVSEPPAQLDLHGNFNRRVRVSTPHSYPIKQVEGCIAYPSGPGMGVLGFGHRGDKPRVDERAVVYRFWAEFPEREPNAAPVIRWVDWHGNRYYQYRHYTERFSQNTDWGEAAQKIDEWIRTGPNPD